MEVHACKGRAGLLHDIGKAFSSHEAPGSHVHLGAEICKRYDEWDTAINAIYAPPWAAEEPINVESASVCAAGCFVSATDQVL